MNIGKEKKMNKEEAIDILKNCIADYVIGDFCVGKFCPMEKECKDKECVFEQAINIVSNYIEELEKRLKEKENIVKKSRLEAQKYFDMLMEVEYGRDTIPKQKIRDKIEELKEIADEDNKEEFIKIDVLKELLGE